MKLPTADDIAKAKEVARAAGVDEVHLLEVPSQGTSCIVRKLTRDEFVDYMDRNRIRGVEGESYVVARSLLWPTYDELRTDWPACDVGVSRFVRALSGSVAEKAIVEDATRPDMIRLGVPEAQTDDILAKASPKAIAIVRVPKLRFECVYARPSPEEFDALRDKLEIAQRDGGFQHVMEMCVARVVWCREEIGALIKRWPGIAEDLFTVSMRLGGLQAEMSSKRL
jgi:hypothetical protein